MEININNVAIELPEGATLQDALDAKGIAPQGIATAVNGKVVADVMRSSKTLKPGDSVVVIKAFYGG